MNSKNKIKENENFSSGFYDWAIFLINFYQRINKRLDLDFESFIILQVVVSYNVYLINKNKKLSLESLSFEFEKSSNAEFLNDPKLTVTSISSSLNMPRETVKRKVLLLQNKNFVIISPNKTIQMGKNYTKIFPDFASGTTLDLARLIQRWDKKDIVRKFLDLKI
mgnify:FL=1|jgi:hypothetical protein